MTIFSGWMKRRKAIKAEAARLLETHGPQKAWHEARANAVSNFNDDEQRFAWKVLREVERRTNTQRQADTATRYLTH